MVLRPVRADDLAAFAVLANDPAVAPRTARMPYPFRREDAEAWFALHVQEGRELVLVLERRTDGAVMGAIGLEPREDARAVVGFWLGRPHWNQGLMTEALCRVLAYAFEERGLAVVEAGAFPDNPASLRVQEKAGLRPVRRERQPAPARGGDRDVIVYEIRREGWRP